MTIQKNKPSRKTNRENESPASIQQMLAFPPVELKIDGEKYLLGFDTQDAKGRLESLVGAKVWERVYAEADRMKPAIGERHIKRHEDLFAAGHYAAMGDGWRREVLCPAGVLLFFQALLQEHQPEIDIREVTEIYGSDPNRCNHALAMVAPDFFVAILRQMGASEEDIEKATPELTEAIAKFTEFEGAEAPNT